MENSLMENFLCGVMLMVVDQIKKIFPRLYQLHTIYSVDCHRRTEKNKKKTKEEELLLQNYILLFFRKYMYESRATEIMIINIFIIKLATI